MNKVLICIFFTAIAFQAGAQTLSPSVISTSGNYYTGAGITWSWTMGETVIPTYQDANNILSQGFQQPEVQVTTDTFANPICAGSNFTLPFTSYSIIGANNVYTAQLSNVLGSFASPVTVGTTTGNTSGTINVTIPGGTASGNYRIRVVSSLPVFNTKDTGVILVIATPSIASVSISTSQNTICAGTNATFMANTPNGGTNPIFQWQINGSNAGTNSNTFSSSALASGNIVSCIITSDAVCVTSPGTSNSITMTVNPVVKDSVSISANPGTTICTGTSVTFNAAPFNGGSTPAYQWTLNGTNVGSNGTSYTNGSLNNSDIISCVLTSNATCVTGSPATSNSLTITVSSTLPLSASVTSSDTAICSGTTVDFTASSNGGGNASYQWELDGNDVGNNTSTYSNNNLNSGDIIKCIVSSNAACVTGSPATSNVVKMTVTQSQVASVSITSPNTSICAGNSATFTANPGSPGLNPSYQWQVNGTNVGTNSNSYSSSTLNNGDIVTCIITSNVTCVTGSPATSNQLSIIVNPNAVAGTITTPKDVICENTVAHFTLSGNSGGTIQWQSSSDSTTGFTNISAATTTSYSSPPLAKTMYYKTIVGSGPCADTTATIKITVIPAPVAAFTFTTTGKQVSFDGTPSTGATSYTWDFGDESPTSTVESPSHTFDSVKTYHVCLTVNNSSDCTFTLCLNVATYPTGINNVNNIGSWLIYPDPFSSQLYISTGQAIVNAENIALYDVLGRIVFYKQVNNTLDNPTRIDVPGLTNGVYFLSIKTKDGNYVKSVVKQ